MADPFRRPQHRSVGGIVKLSDKPLSEAVPNGSKPLKFR
jgi:hypothetical protein